MKLVNPLAGVVTSGYDLTRRHPVLRNSDGSKRVVPHLGADLAGRPRDGREHPIHAAAAGTVVDVRTEWPGGDAILARLTGKGCLIKHAPLNGRTLHTYYGHLSTVRVRSGQEVSAGQVIGLEGATGDVSGAHLHLEVWLDGKPVDPAPFFASRGVLLGAGPTSKGDIMATLDSDDLTAIAKHVWAHGPEGRNAWDVLDRTNQAVGRLDVLVPKIAASVADVVRAVLGLPGAVWAHLTPSGRPAGEVIDKTNHAAGRLEERSR